MMGAVLALRSIPDGQTLEEFGRVAGNRIARRGDLQKALDHTEIEGFTEPPGPTEQQGHGA